MRSLLFDWLLTVAEDSWWLREAMCGLSRFPEVYGDVAVIVRVIFAETKGPGRFESCGHISGSKCSC